jgi:hypothetical protein
MQVAARPRGLKLGVGLATASVIAVSPLLASAPVASLSASPAIGSTAVHLAAVYNPVQPWIEALQTAWAGSEKIGDTYFAAPSVLLQQFLANQAEHLGEVLKNPASLGTVLGQVVHNIESAFLASTLLGFDTGEDGLLSQQSLDGWHEILRQSIPKILPEGTPPLMKEVVQQVLNVLSSPLSGVAMGFAGPFISPVVAVMNSVHEVVTALFAGDIKTAVQNVIDIPANVVGAVLNGATLNLDGLVPVLNKLNLLAPGTTLHNLSIAFGGIFSPGVTGVYEDGIGGSIFNAIGLSTTTDMMGFPLTLDIPGRAIGPISALVSLSQILAKAIGWDGTGNPLVPADEPENELVSTATTTNESPTTIPGAATSPVSLTVSSDTVADAGTSASESTADESVGGAQVTDDTESGTTDDANDTESDDADADAGTTVDTNDADADTTDDTNDTDTDTDTGTIDDTNDAGTDTTDDTDTGTDTNAGTTGDGDTDRSATTRDASDSQE